MNELSPLADHAVRIASPTTLIPWNSGLESRISAKNDSEALAQWVTERGARSKSTKDNYIREGNRFLIWLQEYKLSSIGSLQRTDVTDYVEFLRHPPEEMIGAKKSRSADDWRPFFEANPSESSVKHSFGVICALLAWLASTGYIKYNPAEKLPRARTTPKWRRRALSDDVLGHVLEGIEAMPRGSALQDRRYRRMRWIFHLLRLTGMRISEIQSSTMGDVRYETRNGKRRCFLQIVGKGQKERWIPVIEELEHELTQYRQSLGLDGSKFKSLPLVGSIESGRLNEPITRQAIHNAVKLMIGKASVSLIAQGLHTEADLLEKVSAHWFRHTYATNLLDSGASLQTGRDNLGHASLATTGIYSHSNLDSRFDETARLANRIS